MSGQLLGFLIGPFEAFGFMRVALVASFALALANGPVGTLLLMRRESLSGYVLSHAVMPGAALGFLYAGYSLAALSLGGLLTGLAVAGLAFKPRSSPQRQDVSLIAFYLVSLSFGILIVAVRGSQADLMHVLFGTVLAVDVNALLGTRQRLAYALLFYTGQRGGDVVRMRRADISGGAIRVIQEKTGVELSIRIHPDLADAIRAAPTKGLNLIGDANGRPIKRPALSHLMRQAIRLAGLPDRCVPHGIRKATLRTMAEHGATAKQLAAVSGHKTTKELDRYTAAADQPTLAGAGIASLPIRR